MPTRDEQREALAEGNTAFDAGTDLGFLFRETATGAVVGGGGNLADVDRIEIHMDRANTVSARVAMKVGYRLLRTEQREKLALGHTGEGYVWQKRRDEWTPPPRP